ncbi:MAG: hypothetical protein ATN35_08610 [Epulopiscium sp. Nele67-Bin004]|nr:MAG: hypothetical protein ATN35_08610 [Epulopiscium sp. Nele67-Bin004]
MNEDLKGALEGVQHALEAVEEALETTTDDVLGDTTEGTTEEDTTEELTAEQQSIVVPTSSRAGLPSVDYNQDGMALITFNVYFKSGSEIPGDLYIRLKLTKDWALNYQVAANSNIKGTPVLLESKDGYINFKIEDIAALGPANFYGGTFMIGNATDVVLPRGTAVLEEAAYSWSPDYSDLVSMNDWKLYSNTGAVSNFENVISAYINLGGVAVIQKPGEVEYTPYVDYTRDVVAGYDVRIALSTLTRINHFRLFNVYFKLAEGFTYDEDFGVDIHYGYRGTAVDATITTNFNSPADGVFEIDMDGYPASLEDPTTVSFRVNYIGDADLQDSTTAPDPLSMIYTTMYRANITPAIMEIAPRKVEWVSQIISTNVQLVGSRLEDGYQLGLIPIRVGLFSSKGISTPVYGYIKLNTDFVAMAGMLLSFGVEGITINSTPDADGYYMFTLPSMPAGTTCGLTIGAVSKSDETVRPNTIPVVEDLKLYIPADDLEVSFRPELIESTFAYGQNIVPVPKYVEARYKALELPAEEEAETDEPVAITAIDTTGYNVQIDVSGATSATAPKAHTRRFWVYFELAEGFELVEGTASIERGGLFSGSVAVSTYTGDMESEYYVEGVSNKYQALVVLSPSASMPYNNNPVKLIFDVTASTEKVEAAVNPFETVFYYVGMVSAQLPAASNTIFDYAIPVSPIYIGEPITLPTELDEALALVDEKLVSIEADELDNIEVEVPYGVSPNTVINEAFAAVVQGWLANYPGITVEFINGRSMNDLTTDGTKLYRGNFLLTDGLYTAVTNEFIGSVILTHLERPLTPLEAAMEKINEHLLPGKAISTLLQAQKYEVLFTNTLEQQQSQIADQMKASVTTVVGLDLAGVPGATYVVQPILEKRFLMDSPTTIKATIAITGDGETLTSNEVLLAINIDVTPGNTTILERVVEIINSELGEGGIIHDISKEYQIIVPVQTPTAAATELINAIAAAGVKSLLVVGGAEQLQVIANGTITGYDPETTVAGTSIQVGYDATFTVIDPATGAQATTDTLNTSLKINITEQTAVQKALNFINAEIGNGAFGATLQATTDTEKEEFKGALADAILAEIAKLPVDQSLTYTVVNTLLTEAVGTEVDYSAAIQISGDGETAISNPIQVAIQIDRQLTPLETAITAINQAIMDGDFATSGLSISAETAEAEMKSEIENFVVAKAQELINITNGTVTTEGTIAIDEAAELITYTGTITVQYGANALSSDQLTTTAILIPVVAPEPPVEPEIPEPEIPEPETPEGEVKLEFGTIPKPVTDLADIGDTVIQDVLNVLNSELEVDGELYSVLRDKVYVAPDTDSVYVIIATLQYQIENAVKNYLLGHGITAEQLAGYDIDVHTVSVNGTLGGTIEYTGQIGIAPKVTSARTTTLAYYSNPITFTAELENSGTPIGMSSAEATAAPGDKELVIDLDINVIPEIEVGMQGLLVVVKPTLYGVNKAKDLTLMIRLYETAANAENLIGQLARIITAESYITFNDVDNSGTVQPFVFVVPQDIAVDTTFIAQGIATYLA